MQSADGPVSHRHVMYVAGFDPQTARNYHARYRAQAARQALAGGAAIEVGPRQTDADGYAFWILTTQENGRTVHTRYTFMDWSDIVRSHWSTRLWQVWWQGLWADFVNLRNGALRRMLHSAWPPMLAAYSPLIALLFLFAGIALLGGVGWAARDAVTSTTRTGCLLAGISLALAITWRGLVRYAGVAWLLRSFHFNVLMARGAVPELDRRVAAHATKVRQGLAGLPTDSGSELLVVGHSSGAILAVSMLAEALRQDPGLGGHGPRVSLLTLGQCIPILGCFPQAQAFRADLAVVGQSEALDWIDFSAPPDASCFALSDPLRACGVDVPSRPPDRPKLLSPQFAQMFEPGVYRRLRRDRLQLHFQYLNASEIAGNYDYFRITAGDQTLAARFAALPSVEGYAAMRLWKSAPPPFA